MSVQVDVILTYDLEIDFISDNEIVVSMLDGITVYQNGTKVGNFRAIDFKNGTNTTAQVDNYGNRARVYINSTASGSGGGDMLKSENLSGLANYTTARSNLGLGTLATQSGTFTDKQNLVNAATALVDGATIDLTAIKHTLACSVGRTFTISYTGDDITLIITYSATSGTFTFPATTLCVANGTASGDNTMAFTGVVSGDKLVIAIKKIGSDYYAVGKNFRQ